jgi:polysaccharide biosynthesis/export protein
MKVRLELAILVGFLLQGLAMGAPLQQHKNVGQPPAAESAPAAPAMQDSYVISPGDLLDVQVWKEPDVTKVVPVRPDGKISLPLVNDIQAAGLTATALTANITDALKKYITDPQVTVIVTQVNSQRIYIMGEVARGGTYPLLPGMTVLQGLSDAGGFTPFANTKKIYVLRKVNGKQTKLPFDYKAVINGKRSDENILLQAGDTIVIP